MEEFFAGIWGRLREVFDAQVLGQRFAGMVADLVIAGATFLVFYLVWRILARVVRGVTSKVGLDATAAVFVETILKYTVLTIGLVTALSSVGIDTASVITSLGIAGLTVGFAARDALSNVISGLFIFWDRPFVIGDLVEVGDHYGRVDDITLRSTRVVTVDGRMLAVPNSIMVNSTVASYTNFPHLRLDVPVTVGVGESIDRVRTIALGLVSSDQAFLKEPAPVVVVKALNDYNVELELRVWLDDERQHVTKRTALRESLFNALTREGVDMPFETLQIRPVEVNVLNPA